MSKVLVVLSHYYCFIISITASSFTTGHNVNLMVSIPTETVAKYYGSCYWVA